MCGIAGFLNKRNDGEAPVGRVLLQMLGALAVRGPDSAGVALFGRPAPGWTVCVKVGETEADPGLVERAVERAQSSGSLRDHLVRGPSLRLSLGEGCSAEALAGLVRELEALGGSHKDAGRSVEVVSAGRSLEIVKQVGGPEDLEAAYGVSAFRGGLGIGHTRLSTESRVDLSHSQPFWAHGVPDVAAVHNGHITNYHRLRRIYEQRGVRFYTENDSEIIGIYLRMRLEAGASLEEAMRASMTDFDGSFCYLAAAPGFLGFARDPYGFKPLVVAETEEWVAVATEEVALRQALGSGFPVREPGTRRVEVWEA